MQEMSMGKTKRAIYLQKEEPKWNTFSFSPEYSDKEKQ